MSRGVNFPAAKYLRKYPSNRRVEFTAASAIQRESRREEKDRIGRRGVTGAMRQGRIKNIPPEWFERLRRRYEEREKEREKDENHREKILKGNYSALGANNRYRTLCFV